MKPLSIPYFIIGLVVTLFCNYTYAQNPVLQISANPTTCNGSEGSITFSSLTANASYQITYTDDGVTVGPVTLVSNGAGQLTIPNLNAGAYSDFIFDLGGNVKQLLTGTVLSNPSFTPTFNPFPVICQDDPPPALPTTSNNGYSGTWTPAVIDNQQSGTYTFVPTPGNCASTKSFNITVTPRKVATFSFLPGLTLCGTGPVPVLPNTSLNGITGTWSPAVVDPNRSGTYVFTPTSPGCVAGVTFTVIVNPVITPQFPFSSTTICDGDAVQTLPNVSTNGITGNWSPAVVSNTTSGIYTFTPDAGQCSRSITYSVAVFKKITPVFSFNNTISICSGATAPVLPATSINGITGTWTPAVVSNTASGTYTFNSTSNPCAPPVTLTVTVNPVITPTFSFGASTAICENDAAPVLPKTSSNGITGTWSPAVVSNTASGTYTFNSTSDPCAPPVTFTVTVNPLIKPVFSFGPTVSICAGATAPVLPTTSDNGVAGTWTPAVVSNTASGTYTFRNTAIPCVQPVTLTVIVNPIVKPTFAFGTAQSVCINTTPPVLPTVSNNGITGTWSPATIDNQHTATYTFTPAAGECATATTLYYEVNPIPSVENVRGDTTVYDGDMLPPYTFSVNIPITALTWANSNASIGLPATGSGPVPSFPATNMTDDPISGVITATPHVNGCAGVTQSYKITVLPKAKDIFVPNVFSPNNDGKNDLLYVYGNYITTMELHVFNQWGQKMITLTDKKQGWDGKFKGSPQPVGVYVYVLKAVTTDGRTVNKKGSITLVR